MSVDIAWDTITSGPDGEALAEKIRAFVHAKFQQITLPRFINSVHVHAFDFGTVCPEIEIKDICDPLPDFYEDAEDSEDENNSNNKNKEDDDKNNSADQTNVPTSIDDDDRQRLQEDYGVPMSAASSTRPESIRPAEPAGFPGKRHLADPRSRLSHLGPDDHPSGPFPRSGTPGIPGGTSYLSYFHLPVGGLSGTQTPLAAVASGNPFAPGPWRHDVTESQTLPSLPSTRREDIDRSPLGRDDPPTRPSTANSLSSPRDTGSGPPSPDLSHAAFRSAEKVSDDLAGDEPSSPPPLKLYARQPTDLQVIAHVKYSGNVRMTLTAEILLDYPMPSFVGIPLKLAITGMTFDGVAILAYIRRKMYFCFLDPEDAEALVGEHVTPEQRQDQRQGKSQHGDPRTATAGLLREIHVESEIGRQEDGKQVLKNVGKVEKFVLEQVRRIFEDEFVFPSFWTFLV